MASNPISLRQNNGLVYRAESDPAALLRQLTVIRSIADGEKEALGFLPEGAYREAIEKGRLLAMCTPTATGPEIVGFVLFSGVFPNARIQQIAVAQRHRRAGIASALVNEVVSRLEGSGYLTITAAVASDLAVAQSFYERNGFVARRSHPGGQARNRTIVLRARDLETASLFSVLDPRAIVSPSVVDLGLRLRSASQAPLYAIDLNVLFDVVRDQSRPRAAMAQRVIGAALAHQIRLAVAPEFVVELERTSADTQVDPILKLARQLPRLPSADRVETERVAALVHGIVFAGCAPVESNSPRSLSDAKHLAQAALARASGYVTSDGRMLSAREQLLQRVGIDVASLDEFAALLPVESQTTQTAYLKGTECAMKPASPEAVRRYLESQRLPATIFEEFGQLAPNLDRWKARAVIEATEVVAVGVCVAPANIDAPARVLVHVRADHVSCEVFADHLIDTQCQEACTSGPVTIELPHVPGQSVVRRAATLRGFLAASRGDALIKVALGRPVTNASWAAIAKQTRRRTGLRLPETPPDAQAVEGGLEVQSPDGRQITVRVAALEEALRPTLLVWPGRDGVIVPIAKAYADDLLGTSDQLGMFGSPEAAFLARRTYFNSPRTAAFMRPGLPILFYESKRSRGRGAIVAAARIVDATVMAKEHVPEELLRRAVVEDLDPLSATTEVLATSFDNLLRFPAPVSLETLRVLGAVGAANLQTTTALASDRLSNILELGWSRA